MTHSEAKWPDCRVITKVIDNHEIKADVVIPPNLQPGHHPLVIAFHGGYLISGARDHYLFVASWLPAYAASTSALIVVPDYRLFPSAQTSDVLADVESLWQWVQSSLPDVLASDAPEHTVDLTRILVEGNSAGGFCGAHLAIDHADQIRAAILVYPMVDCLFSYLANGPPDGPPATIPYKGEDLERRILAARDEGWVSERRDQNDLMLTISIMKSGKFGEMFGTDEHHNPLHKLRQLKSPSLPRIWILQGRDDTGVPAQGAIDFADELRRCSPATDVALDVVDTEPSEHGFDRTWTMKDEKLTKRLDWINEAWLKVK